MILQVAAALLAVVAPTGSKERAPPAWRALQLAELPSELASGARGKLHGAPPCLRSLRKVGWGHTARWRLGAYSDGEFACDVDFALDKNPDEPCCKLLFHADDAETGRSRRVGYMLLGAEADASALRGMHVREDLRGRGLSRLLLAVWLALCSEASLTPATKVINKPYLALTLQRFGFAPTNRRGQVRVFPGTRRLQNCRGWQDERGSPAAGEFRSTFVRTDFELADAAARDAAVEAALGGERFALEADAAAVRRALTLRGGAWSAPKPRKPTPTEAGALGGFAIGLALAPTKTQALYGDIAVRTAEAWRKRVMSRKKIPVYARVPRALAAAAAATFVVDYAIAYPEYGARGAVRETTIVRAAERAAAAARARADGVVARVQSLRARLSPGS